MFFHQTAHLLRDLLAALVTGICISAVYDDRARKSVLDIFLRNENRRAFDEIFCVNACRGALRIRNDERQIFFYFVLTDPTMNSVGAKSFRSTNAALNLFKHEFTLSF